MAFSKMISGQRLGMALLSLVLVLMLLALGLTPALGQANALNLSRVFVIPVDPNTAVMQTGQQIVYNLQFSCNSLTGPCGALTIENQLPTGEYIENVVVSNLPVGYTWSYDPVTGLLVINRANFLDGTSGEALVTFTIRNEPPSSIPFVIGTQGQVAIDPGPVVLPDQPINIQDPVFSWQLSKVRTDPPGAVPPVPDEPVTYRISLCPPAGVTTGLVALESITFTDPILANAVVVDSGGGTFIAGSPNRVVWTDTNGWSVAQGCFNRNLTLLFPSPTFGSGSPITNTATATVDYQIVDTPNVGVGVGPGTTPAENLGTVTGTANVNKLGTASDYDGDTVPEIPQNGRERFFLSPSIGSNTNGGFTQYVLTDAIDNELQVTDIRSGTWSPSFPTNFTRDGVTVQGGVRAVITYSTDGGATFPFTVGTVNGNAETNFPAPVPNITHVRWTFQYDNPYDGAATFSDGVPRVFTITRPPQVLAVPVTAATPPKVVAAFNIAYDNCVTLNYTIGGTPGSASDCAQVEIVNTAITVLDTRKQVIGRLERNPDTGLYDQYFAGTGNIKPTDIVVYEVQLILSENSAADLVNPVIIDDLSPDTTFVLFTDPHITVALPFPNTTNAQFSASIPPGEQVQPAFTGGTQLAWRWTGANATTFTRPTAPGDPNKTITVRYLARVNDGVPPGIEQNTASFLADSAEIRCVPPSVRFIDGAGGGIDGNPVTDEGCRIVNNTTVVAAVNLVSRKWVRNQNYQSVLAAANRFIDSTTFLPSATCEINDNGTPGNPADDWTRFPCVAQGFPENDNDNFEDFEYLLQITNEGNVPGDDYYLYDVLPYVGDTGSGGPLSGTPRASEFRVILTGPIIVDNAPAGTIIEYNTSNNPCRPEVGVTAGCAATPWTTSIADARSFRIRFQGGTQLAPAQTMLFRVPMRIPLGPPTVTGADIPQSREISWNSFGQTITNTATLQRQLTSEPRKVGIIIPDRLSIGNRVWFDGNDNGRLDATDDYDPAANGVQPGIPGVTVQLFRDDGDGVFDAGDTLVGTDTTDANGFYLFDNIDPALPNNYFVFIPGTNFNATNPLELLVSTTGNEGGETLDTTVGAGNSDNGVDNANPIANGIVSNVINLAINGEPSGESNLSGDPLDGPFSRGDHGEDDNNSNLTVDFGFTSSRMSLGNRLWFDQGAAGAGSPGYNDGIIQPIELTNLPMPNGVVVNLYLDANDNGVIDPGENTAIATTTTYTNPLNAAETGYYLFDNLQQGNYVVEVAPVNFAAPTAAQPDGGVLFDYLSSTGNGTDDNGATDNGDTGIDPPTAAAYQTGGVRSPIIRLRRDLESTTETDDTPNPTTGAPYFGNGVSDQNSDSTIDFGFYRERLSIGNRVWVDSNNNGIIDATDDRDPVTPGVQGPGLPNVEVQLIEDRNLNGIYEPAIDLVRATMLTDANGYYRFDDANVPTGVRQRDYFVRLTPQNFDVAGDPAFNLISTTGNEGGGTPTETVDTSGPGNSDNGIDRANYAAQADTVSGTGGIFSNVVRLRYLSEATTETDAGPGDPGANVTNNNSNLTIDFGLFEPLSLGNRVWIDDGAGTTPFNAGYNDGILNGTEAGRDGVRVELYRDVDGGGIAVGNTASPDFLGFTTTANGGYYLFDGLIAADYVVHVAASNFQAGGALNDAVLGPFLSSFGNEGGGTPTQTIDHTDTVTLNDNGQDVAAPGTTGVSSNLIALRYATQPSATTPPDDSEAVSGTGRWNEEDQDSNLTIDFGFNLPPLSLGNVVWRDDGAGNPALGNDGIQNNGEPGITNVRVRLYRDLDGNGVVNPGEDTGITQLTDANGFYLFGNLPPGRYIVGVDPENFQQPGGANPTAGALFEMGSSRGADATETVDQNAPATFSDNGIDQPAPGTTGVVSNVFILNPVAGEPTGEPLGPLGQGNRGETDARSNQTLDFGFFPMFSIGNRVWRDNGAGANRWDGIQQAGEPGIGAVEVRLYYSPTGAFVRTAAGVPDIGAMLTRPEWVTTTNANGYYLFDGLPASAGTGRYFVWIPNTNFDNAGDPLFGLGSSPDPAAPRDEVTDLDDNGLDDTFPTVRGIVSLPVELTLNNEPTTEGDLGPAGPPPAYGPNSRGFNNESNGNSNLTIDFGFDSIPLSLGNRVWFDPNNSGTIDAGDDFNLVTPGDQPGIPNVRVLLYRDNGDGVFQPNAADGTPILTTTTDANGYYLFESVTGASAMLSGDALLDDYWVVIDELEFRIGGDLRDFYSSTLQAPNDNTPAGRTDSDDNGINSANPQVGGIRSPLIQLRAYDEPLQAAVPNQPYPPTETDIPTAGYGPNGRGTFNQIDSASDLTVDFGFFKPLSIGNRVWLDVDNDGIRDTTEVGIAGVEVRLWRDNPTGATPGVFGPDDILDPRVELTDANGYYLFDGLIPGTYFVQIPPANFTGPLTSLSSSTPDNVGAPGNPSAPDNNDNGIGTTPGPDGILSGPVTLTLINNPINEADFSGNPADGPSFIGNFGEVDNGSDLTIDFGFTGALMSLGNRVWFDPNNNGNVDAGEVGIANVTVSLYRDNDNNGLPDGPAIRATLTDASGYYLFEGLTPGRYLVGLNNANFNAGGPLTSLVSTTNSSGIGSPAPADNEIDSDANPANNQDNGIDPLNATYGLLSSSILLERDLENGTETDLGTLGDGTGVTPINSELTIDFGLFVPQSIGNRVWFDTDNNGLINGTEGGVAGVTVRLYRDNPTGLTPGVFGADDFLDPRVEVTDANGYYLFDRLGDGTYFVRVEPLNFQPGGALVGTSSTTGAETTTTADTSGTVFSDNGVDDVAPQTNGIVSNPIVLSRTNSPVGETDLSGNPADGPNSRGTSGEVDNNSNLTVDFGFVNALMSLGNRLWYDVNRDGIRDAAELPVAAAAISLYRDNVNNLNGSPVPDGVPDGAAIATTTTDANGYYLFTNLAPGNYIVGVDAVNFGPGRPLLGYGSTLTGAADTDDRDNGVDNPNPPINGVLSRTVTLVLNNEPPGETDLGPGGTGGATDTNSNLTVDMGFYRALSLGNRVWFDPNNNGLIDATEVGISGVTVRLWIDNGDGIFDPVTDTNTGLADVTDPRGYYLFGNLLPGSYFVQIEAGNFTGVLNGFQSSTVDDTGATVDSTDNGQGTAPDATNGIVSNLIALAETTAPVGESDNSGDVLDGPYFRGVNGEADNSSNLTVDFGFNAPSLSLGNRVWRDNGAGGGVANDGLINGTEPGVDGVVVGLYASDAAGNPVGPALRTDTTSNGGYYLFEGLPPGAYVVRVESSNFQTGGPLFGLVSSTGGDATETNDTDGAVFSDNGIDNPSPATNGVLSNRIVLAPGTEPATETDLEPGVGDGMGVTPDNSNLTIDFGFLQRFDLGDNPNTGGNNYGTIIAGDGPRHLIVSNLYLGNLVDDENDGQPNLGADGDDVAGTPDDEDGVTFPQFVAGSTQNVEVRVVNTTGQPANLIVWIDFNKDGTFQASEGFAVTVPSAPGTQVVQVPVVVPIDADQPGVLNRVETYARVRLTTDPLTTGDPTDPAASRPNGASNGEVEDYLIPQIDPPGLAIQKTDNLNSIVVGQTTTYIITISNSGTPLVNQEFFDDVPTADPDGFDPASITWTCTATGGASCLSGQPAGTPSSGTGAPIREFVDMPRDSRIEYRVTARVRLNHQAATITNEAIISRGTALERRDDDVNGVIFDPPFGVKTGVWLGGNLVRWTMTWQNTGGRQAATVTDTLQPGQTFAGNLTCTAFDSDPANPAVGSDTSFCLYSAATNTITWSGNIDTGLPNRVEISFDVTVAGDGTYTNVGTITVGPDVQSATGVVTVGNATPVPPPGGALQSLSIIKTGFPGFVKPGDEVAWTITVTNPNSAPVDNVLVTDNVPGELEIIGTSASVGQVTVNGQEVRFTLTSLGANSSATITIRTRVKRDVKASVITNSANMAASVASAQVTVVSELPATGETPVWATVLRTLLVVAGIALLLVLGRHVRLRRQTPL